MRAPPVIPVRIQLAWSLDPFVDTAHAQQFERRLEAELDALVERLGLRGRVDVQVGRATSSRLIRISVHDRPLPYAPDLLRRTWLAVAPPEARALPDVEQREARPGFGAEWLVAYADDDPYAQAVVTSFLERLAVHAILACPSCLVGEAQAADFTAALGQDAGDLTTLVTTLLDLGVSVADHDLIASVIAEGQELGRPLEDTIEALFTELREHRIEIVVDPRTLAELVGEAERHPVSVYDERIDEPQRRYFQEFEQAFFSTFGFVLPGLVLSPSSAFVEPTVAIKIGTWRSLPLPIPLENRELPVDFAVGVLSSELSQRVQTLLGMEEVEYQLAQLPPEPNRLLADTSLVALTRFSLGDLTRVLRALVAEHLSTIDLSGILERLVQFDTVEIEYGIDEPIVFDDRLPVSRQARETLPAWRLHYAFLRRRLRPYLSYFHGGSELEIRAFALDAELEDLARRADQLDDERLLAFRDAVRREFASLPPNASHVIVTKTEARYPIRALLAPEFPELPVLAHSELSPDVDIRWLGRIEALPH